ncbi:hypothetical protein SeLEV6574_g02578 [Synchytrium endobioticum]|uniref:Uncharacterized protein n=1 Tax=Synchytrium endobioticum TaxID=286115 RepID=A0A507D7L4_9FUNG|nr:hypothetical protein SeLEV6574_g02578 [Synchytrium endobioticum]
MAQLFAPNLGSNARTGGLGTIKGEYQCIEDFIVYCITHVRQLSLTLHDRIAPSANNHNSNDNAIEPLFSSYTYPQQLVKESGTSSSYTNLGKCLVEVLNQDRVAYVRMVQQSSHTTIYTTRIAPWFGADSVPSLERTVLLRDHYTNGPYSNIYLKLKDCRTAKDFCALINVKALESLTASVSELKKYSCLAIESPPNMPHHDLIESCKVEIMVTNERSQKVHLGRGTLHLCSGGQGEQYISLNSSRDDSIVLLRARVSDAVDCQCDTATCMLSIAIAMEGHNTVEYTLSITGSIEHAKNFTQTVTRQCMSPASPLPRSFTPSTRTESSRSPPTAIFNNPFAQGLAENAVDFYHRLVTTNPPIRRSLYIIHMLLPPLSSSSQITLSSSNPFQHSVRSSVDKRQTLANTDNEVHILEENGDDQVALETFVSIRSPVVDDQTVIVETDMTKSTIFNYGKISGLEMEDESTTSPSSVFQAPSPDIYLPLASIRSHTSTASSPDSAQSVTVFGLQKDDMTAVESAAIRVSDVVEKNAEPRLQTAEYRVQIDRAKAEATSIGKNMERKKLRVRHMQDRIKFFRSDVAARCQ